MSLLVWLPESSLSNPLRGAQHRVPGLVLLQLGADPVWAAA